MTDSDYCCSVMNSWHTSSKDYIQFKIQKNNFSVTVFFFFNFLLDEIDLQINTDDAAHKNPVGRMSDYYTMRNETAARAALMVG